MPVIQAGASHGLLIHVKCDGANHMEPTPSDHRGAPDISRVVGNLRMNQDNIENGIQRCVIHVKRVGVRLKMWTPKREGHESIARREYFGRNSRRFQRNLRAIDAGDPRTLWLHFLNHDGSPSC